MRYNAELGKNAVHIANIMPAKAKFAARNAPQHLKNAFADFISNAISIIITRNAVFRSMLTNSGIFSMKIISENNPPAAEEKRNLIGLKDTPVMVVLALRRR